MVMRRMMFASLPAMPGPIHQAQQAAWLLSLGGRRPCCPGHSWCLKERCAEGFGHPFGSDELSVDPALGSPIECLREAVRYQEIFRLTLFGGSVDI